MIKRCPVCGEEFETAIKRQKFCSVECRLLTYKKPPKKKTRRKSSANERYEKALLASLHKRGTRSTCVVCGRKFEPKYRGQKYCSKECHEVPLAKSLRRFFVLMVERYGIDLSQLEEVKRYETS